MEPFWLLRPLLPYPQSMNSVQIFYIHKWCTNNYWNSSSRLEEAWQSNDRSYVPSTWQEACGVCCCMLFGTRSMLSKRRLRKKCPCIATKFFKCDMVEGDTIASYIGKIEMVWSQLTNRRNKTFTTKAITAKIMNNLLPRYDSVMFALDSTLDVTKTLENFTLRLFQQEIGLKNRLEGGVKKVTTYAASLKVSETCNKLQWPTLTYEQCQAQHKENEKKKKNSKCHKCGRKGHWAWKCAYEDVDKGKEKKVIGQIIRNQDALTKLSWWTRQSFITCISMLIVVVCNTWQIKGHGSKLINPSIEQKINQLRALMELRWKWKKFGDILVQVKNSDNYEMSVLTNVLHVSNLSKSLFSCFIIAQKNTFNLHMKDGYQLIQEGNVIMTRVTKGFQIL